MEFPCCPRGPSWVPCLSARLGTLGAFLNRFGDFAVGLNKFRKLSDWGLTHRGLVLRRFDGILRDFAFFFGITKPQSAKPQSICGILRIFCGSLRIFADFFTEFCGILRNH